MVSKYTHKSWEKHRKELALRAMKNLMKRIEQDKVKVISYDLWSYGNKGEIAFRLDIIEDVESS